MPLASRPPDRPTWETAVVLGAIPARMVADLLGGWHVPGTDLSVMHALTGLVVAALGVVVARHASDLRDHPLRVPLVAIAALLVVGLVRAPDAATGLWHGARFGSGFVLLLAVGVVPVSARALLAWALGGGAVAVVVSLVALLSGQMGRVEHDGIARLVGAYRDVHTHGLVMALIAGGALAAALLPERASWRVGAVALSAAATLCVALSSVRTAAVLLVLTALGTLAAAGRWGVLVRVALVGLVAVAVHPAGRERAADLVALITLTEPAAGWASIGRFRPAIWANAVTAFLDLPPSTWLLGNGLGGHLTFWKPRDPHLEYLALWFQMGALAPFAWLTALTLGVRAALKRRFEARDPGEADLYGWIVALAVSAALVAVISNTFVARVTLAWWLWGFLGAAARPAPPRSG